MEPVTIQPFHIIINPHRLGGVPKQSVCFYDRTGKLNGVFHLKCNSFHCTVALGDRLIILVIFLIRKGAQTVGVLEHYFYGRRFKGMGAEIVQVLLIIYLHNIAHNHFIPHTFQFNPKGFNVFAPIPGAVIIPCVMRIGSADIDLWFCKAPCSAAPAHP